MPPVPSWEVMLLRRPVGSARARVMGRVRFQAPNAARARQTAGVALAARSGSEPGWSLGVLRPLTPNAAGTYRYVVTFAAWQACGERFIQRDVHRHDVWATDATGARRLAVEEVQAMPGYLPAWRVTQVVRQGAQRDPAHWLGKAAGDRKSAVQRRGGGQHYARRPGGMQ